MTNIYENYSAFLNRENPGDNGVSAEFAADHPNYGADNETNKGSWNCGMTHCRGGWVITLAGEAGRKLEQLTTSEFAAMQIYKASSPIRVSPVGFYETNEVAMADIVKCAAEEAALQPPAPVA